MRHSALAVSIYAPLLFLSTTTVSCAPDLKVGSQGGGGSTWSSSSSGGMGGEGGMIGTSSSSPSSSSNSSSSSASSSSSSGAPGSLGTPCVNDAACTSGHCADGVCCNETCNGTCMKCNQIESMGTCSNVPVGGDDCDVEGQLCNPVQQCVCGISKPTTSTTCPDPWVQGPGPGTCLLTCDTIGACSNGVTCPAGFDCYVECSGPGSCSGINADVDCPEDYSCSVTCSGASSCQADFRVRCSEKGPCSLNCGNDPDACQGAELRCGSNSCIAICDGPSKPTIDPGAACTVTGC